MAKWGTNSWGIGETTSHKAGSSAVFNIAFKREEKKRSYYNMGYSYLVTHPGTISAEQGSTQLCWADETWCSDSDCIIFLISKIRKGVTLILYCCLGLSDEGNSVSRTENFMNFFQWCYISSCNLLPLSFAVFLNNASRLKLKLNLRIKT